MPVLPSVAYTSEWLGGVPRDRGGDGMWGGYKIWIHFMKEWFQVERSSKN